MENKNEVMMNEVIETTEELTNETSINGLAVAGAAVAIIGVGYVVCKKIVPAIKDRLAKKKVVEAPIDEVEESVEE